MSIPKEFQQSESFHVYPDDKPVLMFRIGGKFYVDAKDLEPWGSGNAYRSDQLVKYCLDFYLRSCHAFPFEFDCENYFIFIDNGRDYTQGSFWHTSVDFPGFIYFEVEVKSWLFISKYFQCPSLYARLLSIVGLANNWEEEPSDISLWRRDTEYGFDWNWFRTDDEMSVFLDTHGLNSDSVRLVATYYSPWKK